MIKEKIKTDLISAMKAKDEIRLNILRYILAKIQNQEIAKQKELLDEETIFILQKTLKELNETLTAAQKAARNELIAQSQKEKDIVSSYLPKQLPDAVLAEKIKKIIDENQELYQKNPKSIIGLVIKQLKSQADTSRIISAINSLTR